MDSPESWLRHLHGRLVMRRPYVEKLWRYYDGEHQLAFASAKFLEAFGGLFRAFATNWMPLVVDACQQRLHIDGFRSGDSPEADSDIWQLWQRNSLDAESQLAHTEALVSGEGYVTCWFGDAGPLVTVEPARQAVVAYDPRNRRLRRAGLRMWVGDDGHDHAELFLPDGVWVWRSRGQSTGLVADVSTAQWEPDPTQGQAVDGFMPNPLGVVPMVPLCNRPRLSLHASRDTAAQSEIAGLLPVQDGVNKLLADMMVAAERAAMPQRWATGLELPVDPETNAPLEPFKMLQSLWVSEAPDTQFGQFAAADLSNYVRGIEMMVQHIASQSATPPHYFYLKGEFPSGESIRSAEASLVAKVREKMRVFGEAWEESMRLAMLLDGRDVGSDLETIWADPETRTRSEHIDSLIKLQALAVPAQQLWEDAGYTPTQVGRFQSMRAQDSLLDAMRLTAPPEQPDGAELDG